MERSNALTIINALANGLHPATGEVFPADSPYQHPDTVRALFEAVRALNGSEPKTGGVNGDMPVNTFVRWTSKKIKSFAQVSTLVGPRQNSRGCTTAPAQQSRPGC